MCCKEGKQVVACVAAQVQCSSVPDGLLMRQLAQRGLLLPGKEAPLPAACRGVGAAQGASWARLGRRRLCCRRQVGQQALDVGWVGIIAQHCMGWDSRATAAWG